MITLARSIIQFQLCASASQNLHDNMFMGLISTSMRFFDLNPSGHIMNRFSKDMGCVDEALPRAIRDATQTNLNMIGAILVTSFVSLKLSLVTMIMCVIFILLRKIYLESSMNIKRFETISEFQDMNLIFIFSEKDKLIYIFSAKSPVFTHILSTLYGLPTIRAARTEEMLQNEFDSHQDLNTGTWFMFIGRY